MTRFSTIFSNLKAWCSKSILEPIDELGTQSAIWINRKIDERVEKRDKKERQRDSR